METPLKSPNSKKSRPKYAYTLPEKGALYTALGDPIMLDGRRKYVCGACLLLLKILVVRSWLLSPLTAMHRMPHMQTIPFASSKCGCVLSIRMRNPSLFQNSPLAEGFTFMDYFLTCRCLSEIRATVDGLFSTGKNVKHEPSRSYGERVTLMRERLTVLQSWHVISESI